MAVGARRDKVFDRVYVVLATRGRELSSMMVNVNVALANCAVGFFKIELAGTAPSAEMLDTLLPSFGIAFHPFYQYGDSSAFDITLA
jgi:hypothetical protein